MTEEQHTEEQQAATDEAQSPSTEEAAKASEEEAQRQAQQQAQLQAEQQAQRVREAVDLVRTEGVDLPVGAEEFAFALSVVADERDELVHRLQRTAADYQNYQRRAVNNEREARELTRAGVIQSLIQVLDFFDMAMSQDPATATAEQVIGGVQMIKSEMMRVLGTHGVGEIIPGRGAEFDPTRHEAVDREPAEDIEPGTVSGVRTAGYSLGDRVIRPAKVVVAIEPQEAQAQPADADGGEG